MRTGWSIVFLGGIDWDSVVDLPVHHVVRELSKRHKVFYVDNFGGGRPIYLSDLPRIGLKARNLIRRKRSRVETIPIWQPALIPLSQSRWVSKLNGYLLGAYLRSKIQRHLNVAPLIWTRVRTDTVLLALKQVPRSLLILQVVDQAPLSPVFPTWMRRRLQEADEELTRKADLVFVSARGLLEERKRLNPHTFFFPNGVDPEHFCAPASERPVHMRQLKDPVVIFAGHLGSWVDLELIRHAALCVPEASFLLLGPHRTEVSVLDGLINVYAPGPVPFRDLVNYYRHAAVGIIPYRLTPFTNYTFPSKLLEYLAAGIPVVATPLPELRAFAEFVNLASDPAAFASAIRGALGGKSNRTADERRKDLVEQHSWKNLVRDVEVRMAAALESRERGRRTDPST